jgi:hypothetical protein
MMEALLVDYGVLGCWVVFSIIRERWLLKKMEELSLRFEGERGRWHNERTRWLRTLGRKLSDATFHETQDRE